MAEKATRTADVIRQLEDAGLDASSLSPIGVRPPITQYLRELWERRRFIWYDSRQRAATQNSRNILGNLWLVLRPLVDVSVYFVIFGLLLSVDRGVENFPAFLAVGILLFRSTSAAIGGGAGLLPNNKAIIRAFSFPRASIPIASVLQSAMTSVFTIFTLCVVIAAIPPHAFPKATWLLMVPIFALHTLLNLGITLVTARLGFHFPDMKNMLSVASRFLMYGSGVMFPIERFISDPTIAWIVTLNPLFRIIDMARAVLIDGRVPALDSWLIAIVWIIVLVAFGFVYFWRGEASYGRELR